MRLFSDSVCIKLLTLLNPASCMLATANCPRSPTDSKKKGDHSALSSGYSSPRRCNGRRYQANHRTRRRLQQSGSLDRRAL